MNMVFILIEENDMGDRRGGYKDYFEHHLPEANRHLVMPAVEEELDDEPTIVDIIRPLTKEEVELRIFQILQD